MKNKAVRICVIFILIILTACGKGQDKAGAGAGMETTPIENTEIGSSGTENLETESSGSENPDTENLNGENDALSSEQAITEEPELDTGAETEAESEPQEYIARTIEQSGVEAFFAEADEEAEPLGLSLVSESENYISNTEDWFTLNNLYLPMITGMLSESAAQMYRNSVIDYEHWKQETMNPVFFDEEYIYEWSSPMWGQTEVWIYDLETTQLLYWVQLESDSWYLMGNCAYVRDGILYTGSIHNGYAMGNTCYLMAYDLEKGELLWRSEDQTYNSMNFIVRGDVIICGYGFTAEPDYIYQISMRTGKVISRTPVAKMPDLLVEQNGKLYVHTYSYDYIFEIEEANP